MSVLEKKKKNKKRKKKKKKELIPGGVTRPRPNKYFTDQTASWKGVGKGRCRITVNMNKYH